MWTYVGDYIKFADQKAGVLSTAILALIGFFIVNFKSSGFHITNGWDWGLVVGLSFLIVSEFYLLAGVIWPRYSRSKRQYMSWGGISSFNTAEKYIEKLRDTDEHGFVEDMAKQTYDLSRVSGSKYKSLRLGFVWFVPGLIISSVCWFFGMK